MKMLGESFAFWTSAGWMILSGTAVMAVVALLKRVIMKSKALSPLQYLIFWYLTTTVCFGMLYVMLWGFSMPQLLDGFWRAVCAGALVNVGIQFCNAKAASLDAGEVSLTAPLQAMTPGLITLLALTLGEFPSAVGIAGVFTMASGSWVLLLHKNKDRKFEYLGPLRQLRLLKFLHLQGPELTADVRNKAAVVRLAVCSAFLGTFGLLMDGLFTRRGINTQGIVLGAMTFTFLFTIAYSVWYFLRPDASAEQKRTAARYLLRYPGCFLLLGVSVGWILHVLLIFPPFLHTYVAYVGTLKRFSIIMAVVLGRLFLGEGDFKKRFWAACLIMLGAILISTDGLPARISGKIEGWGF